MFKKVFTATVVSLMSATLLTGCSEVEGLQEMFETTFGITPTTEHGVQREVTSYMNDSMRLTVKDWKWQETEGLIKECVNNNGEEGYRFVYNMDGFSWNNGSHDTGIVSDMWKAKGLAIQRDGQNVVATDLGDSSFRIQFSVSGDSVIMEGITRCLTGSLIERARK